MSALSGDLSGVGVVLLGVVTLRLGLDMVKGMIKGGAKGKAGGKDRMAEYSDSEHRKRR